MRSLSPSHLRITRSQLPPFLHPPLPAVVRPSCHPPFATVGLNASRPMTYISLLLGPRLLVNVDSSLRPTRFLASFRRLKSSAHMYNNMREDLQHIVKYGTSLHGEVFIGGLRVRRADGKPHSEPLPEGFISQKVEGSPQVSSVLDFVTIERAKLKPRFLGSR